MKYKNILTEKKLRELYLKRGYSLNAISKQYNVTHNTVKRYCEYYSIPIRNQSESTRKTYYNDNYFKKWTYNSAYILGFIIADGHLHKNEHMIQINLNEKDKEILDFIKSEICPDRKIYRTLDNRFAKPTVTIQLNINNKEIIQDIKNFGIQHNKTGNEIIPTQLPQKYFSSFLRGVFDGDGHVKKKTKNYTIVSIVCSSKQFLLNLKKMGQFNNGSNIYKHTGGTWYTWGLNKEWKKFRDFIYANGDFALNRKKKEFFGEN